MVVGRVQAIRSDGDGARLSLAIDPGKLGQIPAGVTAQMLPTTLFGERFVALVPPTGTTANGPTLAAGATITQDNSSDAIELQQVLDNVLPLLTAVQPQKLAATLNAVATALDGRGTRTPAPPWSSSTPVPGQAAQPANCPPSTRTSSNSSPSAGSTPPPRPTSYRPSPTSPRPAAPSPRSSPTSARCTAR